MKSVTAALGALLVYSVFPLPARGWGLPGGIFPVIYGADNRVEYHETTGERRELADSVVSLWSSSDLVPDKDRKTYVLRTSTYGVHNRLDAKEKFYGQPMGATCSGSLVGEDLVMTAGHCIETEQECKDTKFVFGFALRKAGAVPAEIPESDVYSCGKLEAREKSAAKGDYALVKLTRAVADRKPLRINRDQKSADIKKGTPVFAIGHPMGLPVKIADDAAVRDASEKTYFTANLDTYRCNSGSPVFNAKTKLVEGILVRGDDDFVRDSNGKASSNVNPQDGGRGEDVTKISLLSDLIPELKSGRSGKEPDSGLESRPVELAAPALDGVGTSPARVKFD